MNNTTNTIFIILVLLGSLQQNATAQQAFVNSDNFVNAIGNLIAGEFTVENQIDDENEIVKKLYYDMEGRLAFQRNYDFEGHLMYDAAGIAIYEYQHNNAGKITEERYYDETKNFFQRDNGAGPAIIKRKFDSNNRMIEISFLENEDQKIDFGTASIQYEYINDQTAYEKHFDSEGILIDFCAPIVKIEFDNDGRIVKRTFMNEKKQVCGRFMEDDDNQVSVIEYTYIGTRIIQRAYNKSGELLGEMNA